MKSDEVNLEQLLLEHGITDVDPTMLVELLAGFIIVVKMGNKVYVQENTNLEDIQIMSAIGAFPILVYGAKEAISERMEEIGIEPEFQSSLRVSTGEMMEHAYIPVILQRGEEIAEQLPEGVFFKCGVLANNRAPNVLGYVGDPVCAFEHIRKVAMGGKIPIVSPIGRALIKSDGYGPDAELNCNADDVASTVATSLEANQLYLATDVEGVRIDGAIVGEMTYDEATQFSYTDQVADGMVTKLENASYAVRYGVNKSVIFNGTRPHNLLKAVVGKAGTIIHDKEK